MSDSGPRPQGSRLSSAVAGGLMLLVSAYLTYGVSGWAVAVHELHIGARGPLPQRVGQAAGAVAVAAFGGFMAWAAIAVVSAPEPSAPRLGRSPLAVGLLSWVASGLFLVATSLLQRRRAVDPRLLGA